MLVPVLLICSLLEQEGVSLNGFVDVVLPFYNLFVLLVLLIFVSKSLGLPLGSKVGLVPPGDADSFTQVPPMADLAQKNKKAADAAADGDADGAEGGEGESKAEGEDNWWEGKTANELWGGTWRSFKIDNMEPYLAASGVAYIPRMLVARAPQTHKFRMHEDGKGVTLDLAGPAGGKVVEMREGQATRDSSLWTTDDTITFDSPIQFSIRKQEVDSKDRTVMWGIRTLMEKGNLLHLANRIEWEAKPDKPHIEAGYWFRRVDE